MVTPWDRVVTPRGPVVTPRGRVGVAGTDARAAFSRAGPGVSRTTPTRPHGYTDPEKPRRPHSTPRLHEPGRNLNDLHPTPRLLGPRAGRRDCPGPPEAIRESPILAAWRTQLRSRIGGPDRNRSWVRYLPITPASNPPPEIPTRSPFTSPCRLQGDAGLRPLRWQTCGTFEKHTRHVSRCRAFRTVTGLNVRHLRATQVLQVRRVEAGSGAKLAGCS